MEDSLGHVEAAIAEVSKARQLLTRSASKQVRTVEERDKLKAVAFAWFRTHRKNVQGLDLVAVDRPYQDILDATARLAARSTYVDALKDAKSALVDVRRQLAAAPSGVEHVAGGPPGAFDSPPNFAALTADASMQAILNRRWEEVQQCVAAGAYLAATVMMGGLLETLLLARINVSPDKASVFTSKSAPRDRGGKTIALSDWKLVAMVEVAHEAKWISKSAKDVGNVLRDFRNYIHPHKEHTDGIVIAGEDARMFWEVCKSISKQVLASVGRSP